MNTAVTDVEISSGEFVWEIRAWSALPQRNGELSKSAVFECAGEQWLLKVYPGGLNASCSEFVSLYLLYAGTQRCVKCHFEFMLFNHTDGEFQRKHISEIWVSYGAQRIESGDQLISKHWGRQGLLRRTELESIFLANDCVRLKVVVKIQGTLTSTVWQENAWKPPVTLLRDMTQMWLARDETADGTLVAGCQKIKVHKCLVAHRSQRLRASFFGGSSETASSEVRIQDFDADIVAQMLQCIYTDDCDKSVLEEKPGELLQIGDAFGVDRMVYLAEQELVRSLTADNVASRLQLGDKHAVAAHLREASIDYIHRHFDAVEETEGWAQLLDAPNSGRLVGEVLRETQRRLKRPREPLHELLQTPLGVKRMRVGEIRAELQRLDLDSTGIREVLEERLQSAISSMTDRSDNPMPTVA